MHRVKVGEREGGKFFNYIGKVDWGVWPGSLVAMENKGKVARVG